jgi:hypothetical protein
MMLTAESSGFIDYLGETTIEMMNLPSTKTVKSSTLNRHHLTKPKSPGKNKILIRE